MGVQSDLITVNIYGEDNLPMWLWVQAKALSSLFLLVLLSQYVSFALIFLLSLFFQLCQLCRKYISKQVLNSLNSLDSLSKRISRNKGNGLKRICLILLFLRIDCSIGLLVTLLSSYLGVNNRQILKKKNRKSTPFYESLGENIYLIYLIADSLDHRIFPKLCINGSTAIREPKIVSGYFWRY